MLIGSYVLGTKFSDGYANDPWAVGFYNGIVCETRFEIVGNNGLTFRPNGFRRMALISEACGHYLVKYKEAFERLGVNLWDLIDDLRDVF